MAAAAVAFEPVTENIFEVQSRFPEPVDVEKSSESVLHTLMTEGAFTKTIFKPEKKIKY